MITAPLVALEPEPKPAYRRAVESAGGRLASASGAECLIWTRHDGADDLQDCVARHPRLRWVQLPSAGIDRFLTAGPLSPDLVWTSAKGAFARPVAEHALALTLGLLRVLPKRARAHSWGEKEATTLHGAHILIIGAGGIAEEYARLTAPFEPRIIACRRQRIRASFADRTIPPSALKEHLAAVDVLLVAAPSLPNTHHLIDAGMLAALPNTAVLVNVGRGDLIATTDLVSALRTGGIAGAALDVTDPEPLSDDHPLWDEPRALITPHTADTPELVAPLLAQRIAANLTRFASGEPLIGVVDVKAGY